MRCRIVNTLAGIIAGLFALGAGCSSENAESPRRPATKSLPSAKKQKSDLRVQPGLPDGESEDFAHLPFMIGSVHHGRKPLDAAPWHQAGGDWTALECSVHGQERVQFTVMVRSTPPKGGMFASGNVLLVAAPRERGLKFLAAFAKAFHCDPPKPRQGEPVGRVEAKTAVLGTALSRHPGGGFAGEPPGDWTATKWFLQLEGYETEVFFNYSLAENRGEFAEKDPDYREDLLQQLAIAFRDGPLPERTPENDPNFALEGPKLGDWQKIGGKHCWPCAFHPRLEQLALAQREEGKLPTLLHLLELKTPSRRKQIGRFEGRIDELVALPNDDGQSSWLVSETLSEDPLVHRAEDLSRVWVVSADGKQPRPLTGPWDPKEVSSYGMRVSSDGRFIGIREMRARGSKEGAYAALHVHDLVSSRWTLAQIRNTSLEILSWETGISGARALVAAGDRWGEKGELTHFWLNPSDGKLTPLAAGELSRRVGMLVSPDGRLGARLHENDRLEIHDLATGGVRSFTFHEYDRRFASEESVEWVSPEYLLFSAPRSPLINARTLKMSFLLAKGEEGSLHFGPGFRWVVSARGDGVYLGLVRQ